MVREGVAQDRPLGSDGVANLVRIPLHHLVLPLADPARRQVLDFQQVLRAMHWPVNFRTRESLPARIQTEVRKGANARPPDPRRLCTPLQDGRQARSRSGRKRPSLGASEAAHLNKFLDEAARFGEKISFKPLLCTWLAHVHSPT